MTSNYIKDVTVAFELYESVRLENERLQQRIDELRDGSCRYNCRTMKEAFVAGYTEGYGDRFSENYDPEDAYKVWLKESREQNHGPA